LSRLPKGTPKDWVDKLLRVGPSDWVPPIPRFADYDGNPDVDWSAEYNRLKAHHQLEMDTLNAVIRELVERLRRAESR
jgi:hypothetical protein